MDSHVRTQSEGYELGCHDFGRAVPHGKVTVAEMRAAGGTARCAATTRQKSGLEGTSSLQKWSLKTDALPDQ